MKKILIVDSDFVEKPIDTKNLVNRTNALMGV